MKNSYRRLGLVMTAIALLLTGCAGQPPASEPKAQTVTVMLDWTVNTNHSGMYLAQQRGYYAQAGLEVKLVEPGDTGGLQLLAAGQADFAVTVAESLVPARAKGVPVVSVATILPHNTSSLISLAAKNITRPRDLVGKTYGGYQGELEKALISALVRCDGGDPAKVTFVPLPGDDFRIGLSKNMYDTAWVMNGWDTIRLRDIDGLSVNTIDFADHFDCIPDWYTPLLAAASTTIDRDPELVAAFLAATARGYAEAAADPAAGTEAIMAAAPELDRKLVTESSKYLAGRFTADGKPWGTQDPAVWTKFVGFLVENDLTPADFDTKAAWTDKYLPEPGR